MHRPEDFFRCEVLFERSHDDLPCSVCDEHGPIIVVKDVEGVTHDLCLECALKYGLRW